MNILLHKNFEKSYKKLKPGEKSMFKERRNLFMHDPFNPLLNNHALKGRYKGYRSINITGDLRVLYKKETESAVRFYIIDTHNNLY
jgi:addiction module RelE/StbE family toxin